MRTYRNKSQLLILFLVVGFLIGIIYQNLVSGNQVITTELFLKSNLQRYLQTEIIVEKYLWYVVKERAILLGIICILSCIKWKKLVVAMCLGVTGFLVGVLTVSAVLQLGMKGILFCIVGILPQGIFYGMLYSMLFVHWYWFPTRQWNRAKTIFVIAMFMVGVLVETYVNPVLVKLIIKIL